MRGNLFTVNTKAERKGLYRWVLG